MYWLVQTNRDNTYQYFNEFSFHPGNLIGMDRTLINIINREIRSLINVHS